MRVIVIGAGLGGLTLAQGLRRQGIDVAVYERDTPSGRPQGVSLHMDDRGVSALRGCLPASHAAMVEATMGGQRRRTRTLSEVDGALTVVGAVESDGSDGRARPGRQTHRPLLRAVLLTGLEDAVRFGAEFTRFERQADGTVRIWCADGTTDAGDVLVGADGIGSVVRRQHLPHVRVVDTGRRMLMGATPLRAVDGLDLIGHDPAHARVGDTMLVVGVLRYTEAPEDARRRWLPALDPGAVADVEDYVMWAVPVAQHLLGPAEPEALWRKARELTADFPSTLRMVVARAWPKYSAALRIGMIPSSGWWPASTVTVLGDAIHLAPGFGGNLALRDAHRLRDALVDADRGRLGLLEAIGAYEDGMRPAAVGA